MQAETLLTPYGMFAGVASAEYDGGGALRGLRLTERTVILTHAGELVPFYGEDTPRRKYKASVTFHESGLVKAVSLEERQDVVTPVGELPAELVTFYETGELSRVFPLDGKISGFWTEEDERALGIPLTFELGFTSFTALLSGIAFYKSGDIRSVTLFPGERITASTARCGDIPVRQGFSLFESGELESLEPAEPVMIKTPAGTLTAYDVNAHGINADRNSLAFDRAGRVTALVTSSDKIAVRKRSEAGASFFTFAPRENTPAEDGALLTETLALAFDYAAETVCITDAGGENHTFALTDSFLVIHGSINASACTGDCASCSLAQGD